MICDRCGMQNLDSTTECSNCGAPMPAKTGCGGFGDILNFESINAAAAATPVIQNGGYNEADMRILINKTDSVIEQNEKNAKISTIAAGISVIVLVCSIAFGVMTMNSLKEAKSELKKVTDELSVIKAGLPETSEQGQTATEQNQTKESNEENKSEIKNLDPAGSEEPTTRDDASSSPDENSEPTDGAPIIDGIGEVLQSFLK